MKKTLMALLLVIVTCLTFGATQAQAVPVIDGVLTPGEWDNTGYAYYMQAVGPNNPAIPDSYDIFRAVLLQEFVGGASDGVYLLVETYGVPSLADLDGGVIPFANIGLNGDFNGDGANDFFISHVSVDGTGSLASQTVTVTNPAAGVFAAPLASGGGVFAFGSVVEYFLPIGSFGTPIAPFPGSFIGNIVYFTGDPAVGGSSVTGSAVPEPGTMMLVGSGLLSMLGLGLRFKK